MGQWGVQIGRDGGDGCSQLVGGVRHEPTLRFRGVLQSAEHAVDGFDELADLVIAASGAMRASRSPGFNASTCLLILATRLDRREPTSQDTMSESTAKMMNVPMEMNCIIVMKESVMALAVLPICVTSILVTVDSGSEVSTVSSCTESIGEQTAVAELPTASGASSRSRS